MVALASCPRGVSLTDAPLAASLVVLAGGASRRMGRPKATLPVADTTLLGWLIERLGPAFSEVLVCGGEASLVDARLAVRFVADRHPGAGPLAGIEAGLAAARHEVAFAVACDMPRVPPSFARWLVEESRGHDAALPRLAGRPEPACAAYRRSALPIISEQLATGAFRAADALVRLRVRYVDADELRSHGVAPADLANLNTPAEYEAFVRSRGKS